MHGADLRVHASLFQTQSDTPCTDLLLMLKITSAIPTKFKEENVKQNKEGIKHFN